jgi:hypothetical protein
LSGNGHFILRAVKSTQALGKNDNMLVDVARALENYGVAEKIAKAKSVKMG